MRPRFALTALQSARAIYSVLLESAAKANPKDKGAHDFWVTTVQVADLQAKVALFQLEWKRPCLAPGCGKVFVKVKRQAYCSLECSQRVRNERKKGLRELVANQCPVP